MPWINEENESNYWISDPLPEKTEEYNLIQENKRYLTKEKQIRSHPRWNYDNGALVDDDYLFYNEGWRVILDTPMPEILEKDLKHTIQNPIEEWEDVDEKSIRMTFTIKNYNDEEIEKYKVNKFNLLRGNRNDLLRQSDFIALVAYEKNLTLSDEFKSYRQELRDFPETIDDILNFNMNDESLWPSKPNTYYGV